MPSEPLGRVLDRAVLDAHEGTRGRMSIVVPISWLREGSRIAVRVPKRIRCDTCDGGGCDGCHRTGAFVVESPVIEVTQETQEANPEQQAAVDPEPEFIRIAVSATDESHLVLRLVDVFASRTPQLLFVHIAAGETPSPAVTREAVIYSAGDVPAQRKSRVPAWLVNLIIVLVAALLAVLVRKLSNR